MAEQLRVSNASASGPEQTEADRVWFAVLCPVAVAFVAALVALGVITRNDPADIEPLASVGISVLAGAVLTIPALVVNAIVFRKGTRTRGGWFVRAAPVAVIVTLGTLIILVGFFWVIRLGMTH